MNYTVLILTRACDKLEHLSRVCCRTPAQSLFKRVKVGERVSRGMSERVSNRVRLNVWGDDGWEDE